jgi:Protein of unknown function (DUF3891)
MIVCEIRDRWQIVLQTDHAELSGEFAQRWTQRTPRSDSLQVAAERHDDGWAVWERAPRCDARSGHPLNFLDIEVPVHLAFYRAGIAAVAEQDPYAGLLVSMHVAGIYRRRYGSKLELGPTSADEEQVKVFLSEQESTFEARASELGITAQERQADYELLQLYDWMSLLFCMNDALAPAASEFGGYRFEPDGEAALAMRPFPFDGAEQRFSLRRRILPRGTWRDDRGFRRALFATPPEETTIKVRAGASLADSGTS